MKQLVQIAFLISLAYAGVSGGQPGWQQATPLQQPTTFHAATMVHTGDVVVAGGINGGGTTLTQSVVMRGNSGQFVPTLNQLTTPRARFATVEVRNATGQSLLYVIGGYTGSSGQYSSVNTVEVARYDQSQNNWRWEVVGTLPEGAGDCRAVYNGADLIVVSGGRTQSAGAMGTGAYTTTSTTINIRTGGITRIGNHVFAHASHAICRYIDQAGAKQVLVAGGEQAPPASTELLVGTTWDSRANPPRTFRHSSVFLSDISGTARMIGGTDSVGTVLNSTEWYDPKSGWRVAPRMQDARTQSRGSLVASNTDTAKAYLVVAGMGTTQPLSTCEIFTLPTSTSPSGGWSGIEDLLQRGSDREVALTSSNVPVVIGGNTAGVEVYQPLRANNVTYASTEVGARSDSAYITITNTWLLPVSIKSIKLVGSAEFLVTADTSVVTLAPGATKNIISWFRPTQQGVRTARLALDMGIVSDTVVLSGIGVASTISIVTGTVNADSVQVSSSKIVCIPILVNNGSDTAKIDSIVIEPKGQYRITKPVGRTAVGPGDTLIVCFEFLPTSRGEKGAVATIYIGQRSYPIAIDGTGIRTSAVIQTSATCDTISAVKDQDVPLSFVLRNIADKPVTITSFTFSTAVPGIVRLLSPTIVPLTLQPGATVVVDAVLTVQREGLERIRIDAASNSDTTMRADLCIVIRSRGLESSMPEVNVGTLCLNDSVTTTITLTNVSGIDPVVIDNIVTEDASVTLVTPVTSVTLQPRTTFTFSIVVRALTVGPINTRVVVNGPAGSQGIPITGTVAPGVVINVPDAATGIGQVMQLVYSFNGLTTNQTTFNLRFATDLLSAKQVVQAVGGQAIDATLSRAVRTPQGATVTVAWLAAPTNGNATAVIEYDVLRGSDVVTNMISESADGVGGCVAADTAVVQIPPSCGSASTVKIGRGAQLRVSPLPASDAINASVINTTNSMLTLQIVSVSGEVVIEKIVGREVTSTLSINTQPLANGAYGVRLLSSSGTEDVMVIYVQK